MENPLKSVSMTGRVLSVTTMAVGWVLKKDKKENGGENER